jgi:hypothetical protein
MICHAEGTDRPPAPADKYRCCYGYSHVIVSLIDHPAVDNPRRPAEWLGESLAGLGSQYLHSISTAAGAYQITRPTWLEIQGVLKLPDFTASSQDDAAIFLVKEKGALSLVNFGQFEKAVDLCSGVWASLPGSTSGQPQRDIADLVAIYQQNGGVLNS